MWMVRSMTVFSHVTELIFFLYGPLFFPFLLFLLLLLMPSPIKIINSLYFHGFSYRTDSPGAFPFLWKNIYMENVCFIWEVSNKEEKLHRSISLASDRQSEINKLYLAGDSTVKAVLWHFLRKAAHMHIYTSTFFFFFSLANLSLFCSELHTIILQEELVMGYASWHLGHERSSWISLVSMQGNIHLYSVTEYG